MRLGNGIMVVKGNISEKFTLRGVQIFDFV